MRIAVAIACARANARLDQTIDAVLAQTDAVTVALARNARALEPVAREHGARVVHARGPGIAAARNAALASCDRAVLALLDDDVCPRPGWLPAHACAWSEGPAELAVVGGPIVPHVVGRRPRWLGDDLLGVFGAVDHGRPSRAIDGTTTRALGGNMSVRVDAAGGLGGFWPMRGHPDLRGWYDSEALLQRDASEADWQLRWLSDAVTDRLVDGDRLKRRHLLALRSRQGALIGAIGNTRPRSLARRQALTSALGIPIALLHANDALVVARLGRTVENLGVLRGRRLAASQLAPTGPTEFRPAVPIPAMRPPRRVRIGSSSSIVLLYHRVDDQHDPLGLSISRRNFDEHLSVLKARTVVPLHELAASVRHGRVLRGVASISFDDGYRDNLVNAAPVLHAAGLPATVFVTTGHIATGAPFAWDVVADAMLGPGSRPSSLTLELGSRRLVWRTDTPRARELTHRQLQAWLRTLSAENTDAVVARLHRWGRAPDVASRRPLTIAELGSLAAMPGISIGAHSQRHLSLARQDESTRQAELGGSRDDVVDWIGFLPRGIAYPYGVPGEDVDAPTRSSARAAGYDHGVVNSAPAVRRDSDPMALPRIAVPDVDGDAFERMLNRAFKGHV